MTDAKGIIFAYSASPDLGDLVKQRTAASLPFGGRYRMIDFSLSSMMNAGIYDVGVIMQRDYQSLLDHLGSGKAWDMDRKSHGLRILPPFGLPEFHRGNYSGTIEALSAVITYIESSRQNYIVLMLGNLCANVDLSAALQYHAASGLEITAICTEKNIPSQHYKYVCGEDGRICDIRYSGDAEGLTALECYIVNKDFLVAMVRNAMVMNQFRFHKEALAGFFRQGGKMGVYMHEGYVSFIRTIDEYYNANRDLLKAENRRSLFPKDRPVKTKNNESVSALYGEEAVSKNSLVADNCWICGNVENSILFPGVTVEKGAKIKNSILMRGCYVKAGAELNCVIADKNVQFSEDVTLVGSERLPIVVPKGTVI